MSFETHDARERTKEIQAEFAKKGDAFGWFEALYQEAAGDNERIPWADLAPNKFLARFAEQTNLRGNNRNALVVGCGLGDDAEELVKYGFAVTGFDVSPKAIEWAKEIHPNTKVDYRVADLFDLPDELKNKFDFVLEVYTIQALPLNVREKAIKAIAGLLASNGELLVVERGAATGETTEIPPFPLWKSQLEKFIESGLTEIEFEDFFDNQEPPARRFRILYQRK